MASLEGVLTGIRRFLVISCIYPATSGAAARICLTCNSTVVSMILSPIVEASIVRLSSDIYLNFLSLLTFGGVSVDVDGLAAGIVGGIVVGIVLWSSVRGGGGIICSSSK